MLALFGIFMSCAYDSPWWVWVIGGLCFLLESKR